MSSLDWNLPRTEDGLQECLDRIRALRVSDEQIELGNGLLALSFLVKWVRSDTDTPPFQRSYELAMEALSVFRQANDDRGQIRALLGASPFTSSITRDQMLAEAETIAKRLDDERLFALVLAARARSMAMKDEEAAKKLHLETLAIFRRVGSWSDRAQCLISLSIVSGKADEKRDYAIEAAHLYRINEDYDEASRCMSIALMNAKEVTPLIELEALVELGLEDSQRAHNAPQMSHFYDQLALIAAARGQSELAKERHRLAKELEDVDGRSPLERWKEDIEMTKLMIDMCKAQGHQEAEKLFKDELKRLKADKPQ